MSRNRGFISFFFLGTGLLISVLGLYISYFLVRNSRLESLYIEDVNQRNLVYVGMGQLLDMDPELPMITQDEYSGAFEGQSLVLTKSAEFASDNNFRVLKVEAGDTDKTFALANYRFTPTEAVSNRAANYVFSSYREPGSATLAFLQGTTCFTGKFFNFPCYDSEYCLNIDGETISQVGFGRYIFFHKGNLSVSKGTYNCNSMVIVQGNLTIASGTVFHGRMIFLVEKGDSGGGITTIGNGVSMDDGLILSQGNLVVGSGCVLCGHFRSSGEVIIRGSGVFSGRTDAGRYFQSVNYIY